MKIGPDGSLPRITSSYKGLTSSLKITKVPKNECGESGVEYKLVLIGETKESELSEKSDEEAWSDEDISNTNQSENDKSIESTDFSCNQSVVQNKSQIGRQYNNNSRRHRQTDQSYGYNRDKRNNTRHSSSCEERKKFTPKNNFKRSNYGKKYRQPLQETPEPWAQPIVCLSNGLAFQNSSFGPIPEIRNAVMQASPNSTVAIPAIPKQNAVGLLGDSPFSPIRYRPNFPPNKQSEEFISHPTNYQASNNNDAYHSHPSNYQPIKNNDGFHSHPRNYQPSNINDVFHPHPPNYQPNNINDGFHSHPPNYPPSTTKDEFHSHPPNYQPNNNNDVFHSHPPNYQPSNNNKEFNSPPLNYHAGNSNEKFMSHPRKYEASIENDEFLPSSSNYHQSKQKNKFVGGQNNYNYPDDYRTRQRLPHHEKPARKRFIWKKYPQKNWRNKNRQDQNNFGRHQSYRTQGNVKRNDNGQSYYRNN